MLHIMCIRTAGLMTLYLVAKSREHVLIICISVIVIWSCLKSMLIAALPALAGDQVSCRIVMLTLQLGVQLMLEYAIAIWPRLAHKDYR